MGTFTKFLFAVAEQVAEDLFPVRSFITANPILDENELNNSHSDELIFG